MKQLLTLCLLVAGLTQLTAKEKPIYHKSGGGLFGYKFVTTTNWPELGKTVVACTDPGLTRCRAAAAIALVDGTSLEPETLESIDRAVTAQLTPEHTRGGIVFNNTYYIAYAYNINEDDLVFQVYTLDEARADGLIR